ncbi:MAG: hypothetical protein WBP41_14555 [Saprospiraceae bacterium]
MKLVILFVVSIFFIHVAWGQNMIPDSLANYEGKTVTVCGKVADTFVTKSEKKITHLNFDHPYPNQSFSVTIFSADLAHFSYVPSEFLKGKNVCVTGKVKIYGGKPEIVVSAEEQLKVE